MRLMLLLRWFMMSGTRSTTTIKYVCVALRADNNGEGGILALYTLLRKMKRKWIYLLAIIGASTLLADGIITPATRSSTTCRR